jgi:hypothetical protein
VLLLAAISSCLGCCCGLLEVLQAKLQLVRVELLRAPAELPTLQLPDQEPQLLDLGLCRLLLGLGSITLDPQRRNACILLGNHFSHLLQHRQQQIGITWKIIQHQRHGAILLAESIKSQVFRSPSRARARDHAGLEPVPGQAFEQGRELRRAQARHAVSR